MRFLKQWPAYSEFYCKAFQDWLLHRYVGHCGAKCGSISQRHNPHCCNLKQCGKSVHRNLSWPEHAVLYLGYYQDETDAGDRAGHCVSLIPRVSRSPLPNPDTFNVPNSESKILKAIFFIQPLWHCPLKD